MTSTDPAAREAVYKKALERRSRASSTGCRCSPTPSTTSYSNDLDFHDRPRTRSRVSTRRSGSSACTRSANDKLTRRLAKANAGRRADRAAIQGAHKSDAMLIYALKRLGVAILVAITVSLVTFSLLHLSGDPAMALAGESATEEDIENIRRVYGYDRPDGGAVRRIGWSTGGDRAISGRSHYLKNRSRRSHLRPPADDHDLLGALRPGLRP